MGAQLFPKPHVAHLNRAHPLAKDAVLISALDVSSAQVRDVSGNQKHGTVSGASWVATRLGQALRFSDGAHFIDYGDVLDLVRPFTIVAVVNRTNNLSNFQGILAKRSGASGYWLTCSRNDTGTAGFDTGRVWLAIDDNELASPILAMADNSGDHVVVAVAGLTGRQLYVDGALVASDSHTANPTGHAGALEIGRETSGAPFGGDVYGVYILNTALDGSTAALVSRDPWALYRPRPRRFWLDAPAAAEVGDGKASVFTHLVR